MRIRSLDLNGFFSHKSTRLQFPATGLIVISGANGSGKTSIFEAVSVGGWGATLRGTSPWADEKGTIRMVTESPDLEVVRKRNGKTLKLDWLRPGDSEDDKALTRTKSQNALDTIIGAHDTWRKTSVFSSHDAALFTMSTDGERKRLLESVLGLAKFDAALKKCRDDLKAARREHDKLAHEIAVLEAKLESENRHFSENQSTLASLPEVSAEDQADKYTKLSAQRDDITTEIRALEQQIDGHNSSSAHISGALQSLEARALLCAKDQCPTCEQPIPEDMKKAAQSELATAKAVAKAKRSGHREEVQNLQLGVDELNDELSDVVEQMQAARMAVQAAKTAEAQRARFQNLVDNAVTRIEQMEDSVADLGTKRLEYASEIDDLVYCERVLGIQGLRSHVLGKALSGLQDLANAWLDKLVGPGLQLKLTPYSEKKAGGVKESIGLEVIGAGGGYGYKGSSGGERRRIDVALLLALAEIAEAASGHTHRAIFFDEVMDSLDAEGTAAVADALRSLAQDRQVFVITHSQLLANSIAADVRLNVSDGKVTQV